MTRKLLLADDSITMQRLVSLTFADENIEVISVSEGNAVARRIKEIRPDIVLVDVFLPGKNGYEICEMVKTDQHMRHVPVLLLVGTFEPLDPAEAQRVNSDGHLTKPFESTVLVHTVKDLLSKVPAQADEPVLKPGKPTPASAGAAPDGYISPDPKPSSAKKTSGTPPESSQTKPPRPTLPAAGSSPPMAEFLESAPSVTPVVPSGDKLAVGSGSSVAFAFSPEILKGNSHPNAENSMDDLLELDLEMSGVDDQTRNSFMVTPILDIYNEPAVAAGEPGVAVAEEEPELLPFLEAPAALEAQPESSIAIATLEVPAGEVAPASPLGGQVEPVTDAWVEAVAQRVIKKLSETVIREIAWEVVPELSELIIREELKKGKGPPKA